MKLTLLATAFACSVLGTTPHQAESGAPPETAVQVATPKFDLMAAQRANGSWDAQAVPKGVAGVHPGDAEDDLWVTSANLLMLLGEGTTGAAGPHQIKVRAALHWIACNQAADGRIVSPGAELDIMVHALATLALTEHRLFLGETSKNSTAAKAVAFLESRALKSGGWNRQGSAALQLDPQTTAWAAMALRSAMDSAIEVNPETLQTAAGQLVATNRGAESPTTMALTSELLVRLLSGESGSSDPFAAAAKRMVALPVNIEANGEGYDPEEFYLRSLVAYQVGGETWKAWLAEIRGMLEKLALQNSSQLRHLICDADLTHGGSVAACGFTSLTLQVYFKYARVIGTR